MASPQLERYADSATSKLLMQALLAVIAVLNGVLGWQFGRMTDRLDHMETLLGQADKATATMDLRIRQLEALVPERGSAIERLKDRMGLVEFRVQDIEGREARSGKKMP